MFLSKVRHFSAPSIPLSQQLFSPCRLVEDKVVNTTSSQCPAIPFYQPPWRLLQAKIKMERGLVETTSRNDGGKLATPEMRGGRQRQVSFVASISIAPRPGRAAACLRLLRVWLDRSSISGTKSELQLSGSSSPLERNPPFSLNNSFQ